MTPAATDAVIRVTALAVEQIKKSAAHGDTRGWPLRIAVTRAPDESFHYAMGFDDATHEDDVFFTSGDVPMVVSQAALALLKDTTIDYVELEPGRFHFIFLNPNDPAYVPPDEAQPTQPSAWRSP